MVAASPTRAWLLVLAATCLLLSAWRLAEAPLPVLLEPVLDAIRPYASSRWVPFQLVSDLDDLDDDGHAHAAEQQYEDALDPQPDGQAVTSQLEEADEQLLSAAEEAEVLKAACPHPNVLPAPIEAATILRERCRAVPSSDAAYSINVCPLANASTCNTFSVVIARTDRTFCGSRAAATKGSELSSTPGEGDWVVKTLGPDAFELTVNGAERRVVTWPTSYSEAECEWRYDISLSNGGGWSLAVRLFYQDYQAMSELYEDQIGEWRGRKWWQKGRAPAWPRLLDRNLLTSPISSKQFSSPMACPASCPSYSFDSNKALIPPPPIPSDSLPLCSRTEEIPRAYLPDAEPYKSNKKYKMAKYRAAPLGCRLSEPDVQLLNASLPLASRLACLTSRKRRLTIQGDSHGRMLYDALLPRLLGKGESPTYSKARYKVRTIGRALRMEFVWDPQMFAFSPNQPAVLGASKPSLSDYMVISTGAHQAFHHTSTRQFFLGMESLADTLRLRQQAGRPTLFISSPAYPPRNGQYVWDNRDWRNVYRLEHWSSASVDILGKMGALIIDGFGATQPFVRDSPDSAHFRDTPAMEWLLQTTLHKLALCSAR